MMSVPLHKYTVHILGEPYTVITDEAELHVNASAEMVDRIMQEITARASGIDTQRIAVLGALRLASDCLKAQFRSTEYEHEHERLGRLIDQELQKHDQ